VSQHVHHKFAALHQSLLRGKLPRSLHWSDVIELIGHLGQVLPQGGNEFAFVVGTRREVFKQPHASELGVEEVSRLRRFLKEAGSESPPSNFIQPCRMVVVIDHHAAHIFRDLSESRPQDAVTITPYDPHHFHRHLIHRKEAHYEGDRVPEEASFYEEVAAALVSANEIVLIGNGTGKSSAVNVFEGHLRKHHIELSRRIKATEAADLSALTDPEIEAIVKRHVITTV
jgi:hypothetical protein